MQQNTFVSNTSSLAVSNLEYDQIKDLMHWIKEHFVHLWRQSILYPCQYSLSLPIYKENTGQMKKWENRRNNLYMMSRISDSLSQNNEYIIKKRMLYIMHKAYKRST